MSTRTKAGGTAAQALPLPTIRIARRAALVGTLAWGLGLILVRPGPAEALLLLAPVGLVPLGLALAAGPGGRLARPGDAASWGVLPAGVILIGAFTLPPGPVAAALALPWFAVTALVALSGINRLATRGPGPPEEVCLDAGLIYLAVGGGWAVLSRAGVRPMGFPDLIVLLTAAHFHYAGFVLPLLTGLAGRALGGGTAAVASAGVVAGVPLVALGIAFSPPLEWIAATLLATSGVLTALLQIRIAVRGGPTGRRVLLAVSGLSLGGGMALAALYAWAEFRQVTLIDVRLMIRTHGAVNALGFGLLGLWAWALPTSAGVGGPSRAHPGPAAARSDRRRRR